jgi:hypothetical protein
LGSQSKGLNLRIVKQILFENLTFRCVFYSLCVGFIFTLIMHFPVLGVLIALTAFPLGDLYPELMQTSSHVEIGFAWIGLKTSFAWLAFIIYFSLLSAPFVLIFQVVKKYRIKK